MKQIELPFYDADILDRLEWPGEKPLTASAANAILRFRFSALDLDRMHKLAAKARAGALNSDEQALVEAYSRVGSLLGILKSKARLALKRRNVNGKAKTN
jgi:hypothetical protein